MKTIEVTTTVDRPPEVVFPFLQDFTGYAKYSKHLRGVVVDGDGGVGTRYRLRFGWWKLTYDAYTTVTGIEAPNVLEWEVIRDLDANGRWVVEATDDGEGSTVSFVVTYDPSSVSAGMIDVPALVPMDWVVEKAIGLIEAEGRRVVRRVVADLEGEARPVELTVEYH
ncbi:Polyketide cyclase/dehydrase family protein [Halanaeroarchaeum sp. HSR-CO]|uniref:SRPBCC family protein n=1 Tax=Halanaeroarchaeum sp. HSR-CO TaxID=2866382 RepID=UPI00217D1DD8|nr:SRPBCC family protein [Halanaeroarchaeum sp. HSR-CO]UWG47494.1 Polyketide cyclase/dehydrase family protein [Halanaeroarchaeum sp. HSR-CO]